MKRTIFIGQAMPAVKRNPHDWPSLNIWLYSIGIKDNEIKENFLYSALVDYFPGYKNGSHIVPSESDILKDRNRLKKTINSFDPQVVIPIGKLSIEHCLSQEKGKLTDYIGKTFVVNPYGLMASQILVIPLPHPSGASTWRHNPKHKALLLGALNLLKVNLF